MKEEEEEERIRGKTSAVPDPEVRRYARKFGIRKSKSKSNSRQSDKRDGMQQINL
jgi:hypothetical protein